MAFLRLGTIHNPASMSGWEGFYLEHISDGRLRGTIYLHDRRDIVREWGSIDIPWPEDGSNMCPEHLELLEHYRTTIYKPGNWVDGIPTPNERFEVPDEISPLDLGKLYLTRMRFIEKRRPADEEEDDGG